jgi:hypothetical protein
VNRLRALPRTAARSTGPSPVGGATSGRTPAGVATADDQVRNSWASSSSVAPHARAIRSTTPNSAGTDEPVQYLCAADLLMCAIWPITA